MPQAAFIFGETVRNNILFGLPYEEQRYQHAIDVACLGPDLASLQGGAPKVLSAVYMVLCSLRCERKHASV